MQRTTFSTADVASLFNVTETTVKRWADTGLLRCQKTPGGHRKFVTSNITEFADNFGLSPNGTLKVDDDQDHGAELELAVISRGFDAITTSFVQRGLADTGPGVSSFLSYLYQHNLQLWEIMDRVVRPGMITVGDQWKQGDVGIGSEHRISERTIESLAQLKSQVYVKPSNGLTAICACPEEVVHDIGLRCVRLVLEAEGWKVHYLGANTPIDSIIELQNRIRPSLVCLSITTMDFERPLTQRLRRLFRTVSERNAHMIIGGPLSLQESIRPGDCHQLVHSCRELLEFLGTITLQKRVS